MRSRGNYKWKAKNAATEIHPESVEFCRTNTQFNHIRGKSPLGSSADCDFQHRASPLVSPKPAENHRLPPPFKIKSLSPSGSGSLHFSALSNRARPSPLASCLRFVSFRDAEFGRHRQQRELRQKANALNSSSVGRRKIYFPFALA